MDKQRKLIIVGDSAFAEIAWEYFTHESHYEVVAFAVEREYLKRDSLFGTPVVAFESLTETFDPAEHDVYVAMVYSQLNRLRTRLSKAAKAKGYGLASFVSPHAFVWRNVELGEHVFIFEDNTVQPFVKIGDNVVLWSGNHIGHHSTIGNNCFVSSHVVISGFVDVGENCFLGVNSTIANNVKIGKDCWLAPDVTIVKDTADAVFFKPGRDEVASISTLKRFKVEA
ncbi:MAG TPA: acetyltransferase [Candidatus Elarobacter sp.]|jgi:sugar O-acyltransferase (sialic acid O-acetyltransferase NeuD family)